MFTVFGFYKFQQIKKLKKNQKTLNNFLINNNIYGSVIISKEGINGSVSGKNNDIKNCIIQLKKIFSIKNFDIFFAKGLSLEDGAATITDFTAKLISNGMNFIHNKNNSQKSKWLVCGGGRKNKYLLESIKSNFDDINLNSIDQYELDGDFIESQAFAFLAIRSLKGMPISFPNTTRCQKSVTGGVLVENF